ISTSHRVRVSLCDGKPSKGFTWWVQHHHFLSGGWGSDGLAKQTVIKEKNWPALLILVIIALTVGGNILVILAVSLEKKLQNATNFFLRSLAVADMLVGILVMPISLINILYDYAWPLPSALCPIWIYLDVLFSTASIMHLCAISLDRYVAIRNPIEHSRFNSRTKAMMKIAAVWTISIGVSMPIPVIGLHNEDKVFVNGSCVLNEERFILIGSFVAFFIPLVIMVVTYCLTIQVNPSILLSASTSDSISIIPSSEVASQLSSPAAGQGRSDTSGCHGRRGMMQAIKNERRASKVLGIVFFLFLIMWCPFFITNVTFVLCSDSCNESLLHDLLNVFVWVGYISSGVNPLVYTLFNKTYRRAFSRYIKCQYKFGANAAGQSCKTLLVPPPCPSHAVTPLLMGDHGKAGVDRNSNLAHYGVPLRLESEAPTTDVSGAKLLQTSNLHIESRYRALVYVNSFCTTQTKPNLFLCWSSSTTVVIKSE
uniref:5-hydroxytryptamine (serotonin) receptor 2C, G protein-coupled-like 1 n=1 Tax=Mastacembelus armatus TaxID=205130 RepID=A0A7N8YCY8_9TELE